jgi:hypothetical protein
LASRRHGRPEAHRQPLAATGRRGDRRAQLLGDLGRLREIGSGEQQQELLAPGAVAKVERSKRLAQLVRDVSERGIPGGMSL